MSTHTAEPAKPLFAGLYDFVKTHLVVVNGIVLASGTLVGALDFLAPRLSFAPALIYAMTALLALLLLATALAPRLVARALGMLGLSGALDPGPVWRRPAWQFSTAMLIGISLLGFASVAKASEGGMIASRFPSVRELQSAMLGLRQDMARVEAGVDSANAKLDRIVGVVDPDNPADRCADLACAVEGEASAKAVKSLFDKGARIPGGAVLQGELSKSIATSTKPDRLVTLDLLLANGLDIDAPFYPFQTDPTKVNAAGIAVARKVRDASRIGNRYQDGLTDARANPDLADWNRIMGCVFRTSGGTTLLELAAIRGDRELYRHLEQRGARLPKRRLACAWEWTGQSGSAAIEVESGQVAVVAMGPAARSAP